MKPCDNCKTGLGLTLAEWVDDNGVHAATVCTDCYITLSKTIDIYWLTGHAPRAGE